MYVLRNMYEDFRNADKFGTITIGSNVNIGWDVILMPGIEIGDNVVIGAGSIVTKSIPSNSVAVGIPARVIETIDEYYEKNKNKVVYTKNMTSQEKKDYILNIMKK